MRQRSRLAVIAACLGSLALWHVAAAQSAETPTASSRQKKESAPVPVPVEDGMAALTSKNSTIQFVGTHVGPKPDPRTGYFTKFVGELAVDEATGAPKAIAIEIDTASLITAIRKLTNHLQSVDFFDVRQYPAATFESTEIKVTDPARGKYRITGDLTLREVTKPITFPATAKVTDAGIVLTSKFKIKRTDFGMTFGTDSVVDDVAMTVTAGKPTPKVTPQ